MKLELDLQSPYNPDRSPRTDLPTGEVLATNEGDVWIVGTLEVDGICVNCRTQVDECLYNIQYFSELPKKIEA